MTGDPPGRLRRVTEWAADQDASAVRNAVSMAVPLAVGTAVGNPAIGGLAAIGAFTAMYTHNRPYRQRLRRWVFVACMLVGAFTVGVISAWNQWAAVLTIGLAAVVLTYVIKIVAIGPPGAYILVLACATGTHLPPDPAALGGRVLAVAGGAVAALLVCSCGWLPAPDAPERMAVATAMRAVAAFLRAAPDTSRAVQRHRAQRALHEAALALTRASRRANGPRLAALVRALRTLVDRTGVDREGRDRSRSRAGGHEAAARQAAALEAAAADLRGRWPLRREIRGSASAPGLDGVGGVVAVLADPGGLFPPVLPFPGPFAIWRARTPRAVRSALRAGFAATAAGGVAIALRIDHPYWGAAAAIAVLANDGTRATISRAWSRFGGTLAGVVVAAAIIATHPGPVEIVVLVTVLQFVIQLVVAHSYGLAVVAITPLALLLADAASGQTTTVDLVPRLVETAIGCVLALLARLLIFPNSSAHHLPAVMSLAAERTATWRAAAGAPQTELRLSRLALERALLALQDAIDAARDELRPSPATERNIVRASATLEQTWPQVSLSGPTPAD